MDGKMYTDLFGGEGGDDLHVALKQRLEVLLKPDEIQQRAARTHLHQQVDVA